VNVLRDERGLGTVWGALEVQRVVAMSDGRSWRLVMVRSDGSPLEVYVGPDGRDPHGYVERVA
jgi:hypothetical protein